MAILELKSVSKSYGAAAGRTDVLKNVSLSVKEGEFVAIVGFSGSGKTTLINLMAGLISPDSGEVLFRGEKVTEPGPERGVVFQSYSLPPWLSVEGNVALAVDAAFAKRPHVASATSPSADNGKRAASVERRHGSVRREKLRRGNPMSVTGLKRSEGRGRRNAARG